MADETKGAHPVVAMLKGLGSTRFGVVLAAIGAIYMIVKLAVEAPENADALRLAERALYVILALTTGHIVSRTIKKSNGKTNEQNNTSAAAELD